MTGLRARRLAKASGLRCLRVVRRHHFTLLSAAVLAGVLAVALTSNAFYAGSRPAPPVAAAEESRFAGLATVLPSPTLVPPPPAEPSPPSVVYYFIDSDAMRYEMEMALHRDLADEALRNYAPLHKVSRIFVMIKDARDEAEALEFLRQLTISPPLDGTLVRVVDLR